MNDPVRELYSERRYPHLSHPATDISGLWVSARMAGLEDLREPARGRVLEFGCAAGQNLLPLAERYPEAEFTGLDYSDVAIRKARQAASAAGLGNIRFETADLLEWRPSQACDYLIVHGILSWVPDPVKARVLDLCGQVLSPGGVVCLSYNTLPGWSLRRDVVPLVRALARNPAAAGLGGTVESVAVSLAEMAGEGTAHAANLRAVCRDMARKGPEVLPFDDFAPVCDAFYFAQVAAWTTERGLRYLGEANVRDNLPDGLSPDAFEKLAPLEGEPLVLQQTLDLLSGRTHRASLFCRAEASLATGDGGMGVMEFSAGRSEVALPPSEHPVVEVFRRVMEEAAPSCVPVRVLMETTVDRLGGGWEPAWHSHLLAGWLVRAAGIGGVELRAEPLEIHRESLAAPRLSGLNRHFAEAARPVVDARHRSCRFPEGHERLLVMMDGSRPVKELQDRASAEFPELDFPGWLEHLAERGIVR